MSFFRRCIRCGECTAKEVVVGRFDCDVCGLRLFTEMGPTRLSAVVDKMEEPSRWVDVPEGNMLVYDVGDRPTSEWVSRGTTGRGFLK